MPNKRIEQMAQGRLLKRGAWPLLMRNTLDARGGTQAVRPGLSFLLLAILVLPVGCAKAPPSAATPAPRTPSESTTEAVSVGDLMYNLQESVAAEPSADVDQGLFLGYLASVESLDATPALVLDFVTADMQPGVTVEQRRKSSWPRYFGWNRVPHSQRAPLAGSAVISLVGNELRPTSLEALASEVESGDQEKPRVWCIALSDGQVTAVWPWMP